MKQKHVIIGSLILLALLGYVASFDNEKITPEATSLTSPSTDKAKTSLSPPEPQLEIVSNESATSLQLITAINNSDIDSSTGYEQCLQLQKMLNEELLTHPSLNKTLIQCRAIRNRNGISDERIKAWNEIRALVRTEGWQSLIEKIKAGEIPIDVALQDGVPKHDLFTLLAGESITDIKAYESLIQLGLSPSSKALNVALIRKNKTAIAAYEKYANLYAVNDLLQNVVYQSATYGSLADMDRYINMGISYEDVLNRDPLQKHLSIKAYRVSVSELKSFLHKNNITLTAAHKTAAISGNGNKELLDLIEEMME